LLSIDTYRGWVMVLMLAEVLRFCAVAEARPESRWWAFLCSQQSHAAWTGCTLHDLIQPGLAFLVGVALPFSLASPKAFGTNAGSHAPPRQLRECRGTALNRKSKSEKIGENRSLNFSRG